MSENRRYTRVDFHASATVTAGESVVEVEVLDLSIHGVRIRSGLADTLFRHEHLPVCIQLGEFECIALECKPVFCRDDEIGLEILTMDVESAGHLRRLLTLNLGDSALVERDLRTLLAS